ncbi:hypothetical protein CW309_07705 [Pseudomonas hunanensis]|uniref:Uncharacterized protein n=1 Tax=Pseudomonas hunanensis TaxID=1247546 RepID=A0ACC9N306_9PSED|nr:hypothetical protein CW309_07705 [Pseudomonas hunanensis]
MVKEGTLLSDRTAPSCRSGFTRECVGSTNSVTWADAFAGEPAPTHTQGRGGRAIETALTDQPGSIPGSP